MVAFVVGWKVRGCGYLSKTVGLHSATLRSPAITGFTKLFQLLLFLHFIHFTGITITRKEKLENWKGEEKFYFSFCCGPRRKTTGNHPKTHGLERRAPSTKAAGTPPALKSC